MQPREYLVHTREYKYYLQFQSANNMTIFSKDVWGNITVRSTVKIYHPKRFGEIYVWITLLTNICWIACGKYVANRNLIREHFFEIYCVRHMDKCICLKSRLVPPQWPTSFIVYVCSGRWYWEHMPAVFAKIVGWKWHVRDSRWGTHMAIPAKHRDTILNVPDMEAVSVNDFRMPALCLHVNMTGQMNTRRYNRLILWHIYTTCIHSYLYACCCIVVELLSLPMCLYLCACVCARNNVCQLLYFVLRAAMQQSVAKAMDCINSGFGIWEMYELIHENNCQNTIYWVNTLHWQMMIGHFQFPRSIHNQLLATFDKHYKRLIIQVGNLVGICPQRTRALASSPAIKHLLCTRQTQLI